jgi:hypothetical protein
MKQILRISKKKNKKNLKSKNNRCHGGFPGRDNEFPLFFYIKIAVYRDLDEEGHIDETSEITDDEELLGAFFMLGEKWDEVNQYYLKDNEKPIKGLIDQFTDVILNDIKQDFEDFQDPLKYEIDYINEIFFDGLSTIKVKSFIDGNDPKDDMETVNDAFDKICDKIQEYTFSNNLNYVKYNGLYYTLQNVISEEQYVNQFWTEHYSEEYDKKYYYNTLLKKSQWEKPENGYIKDMSEEDD